MYDYKEKENTPGVTNTCMHAMAQGLADGYERRNIRTRSFELRRIGQERSDRKKEPMSWPTPLAHLRLSSSERYSRTWTPS